VSEFYVVNKVKIILGSISYKGQWEGGVEQRRQQLQIRFKAPQDDINAPNLYPPMVGFSIYIIVYSLTNGFDEGFESNELGTHFTRALLGWMPPAIEYWIWL